MYILYRLTDGIPPAVNAYRQRHGAPPASALVHPSRLAAVQIVLPFARTRQPGDPIPQVGDLLLGGPSSGSSPSPRFPGLEA